MKKMIYIITSILWWPIFINAQSIDMEIISGSGFSNANNNGVSWSLGELAIQEIKSNNNIITQGFHQGDLIVTSLFENERDIAIEVYPNPTITSINIKTDIQESLNCKLYNLQGKLVDNRMTMGQLSTIQMDEFPAGAYYLQILNRDRVVKVFKIQKIK